MHDIRRDFRKQYDEPETDSDEDEEKKKMSIFDH